MISHAVGPVAWVLATLGLGACNFDTIRPIPAPGSVTPVNRLSELHIFEGRLAEQTPRADFVAYDVNAPLYSSGARKRRFAFVPPGKRVLLSAGYSELPIGSYLVKTFSFPLDARKPELGERLLETRFLVKTADGLRASTYVWNDEQSDATASAGNLDIPVSWIDGTGLVHEERYHVPGTSECSTCHAGRALGLRSRQLDRPGSYPDGTHDQLTHLAAGGLLESAEPLRDALTDPFGTAELEQRARSYLDANCGHCHGAGGSAEDTNVFFDFDHTDSKSLPVCRATREVGGNDHVLVPGHADRSEFLSRMRSTDSSTRMPWGSKGVIDDAGIDLLWQWVNAMPQSTCRDSTAD